MPTLPPVHNGIKALAHLPTFVPPEPETQAFYNSWRWKRLRAKFRKTHPLCELCEKEGTGPMETHSIHHRVPVKVDWSKRFDWRNLMAVCAAHHNEIEKKDASNHR